MRREAPGVRGARGVRPGGPGRRERHAADSLNGNLLVPFYREFIDAHPDVLLELHASMSPDINREVEEHPADVGLTFSLEHYPTIAARELFRDRWVVLCRRDHPFVSSADPNDLAGEAEVLMRYPAEYQTWHRHYFARFAHPKIIVSNASQLGAFLDTPGSWCIAPQSVCRPLVEKGSDLVICHLAEEPPVRIARIIIHRHLPEEKRRLVELFERELRACPVPDEDTPAGRRKSGRRA